MLSDNHSINDESFDEYIDEIVKQNPPHIPYSPLKSPETYIQEYKSSLRKEITEYYNQIKKGGEILIEAKKITSENFDLPLFISLIEKQGILNFKNEIILQEQLKLSDDVILEFYNHATELYNSHFYEEASSVLNFLTVLNPNVTSFWLAIGMTEEAVENYEKALIAYVGALEINNKDLQPIIYSIKCLKKMDRVEEANLIIDTTLESLSQNNDYDDFKRDLLALKAA